MFFSGIGTAVPPNRYAKSDCWEAFLASDWRQRLSPRSQAVIAAVLQGDNGIDSRYFVVDDLKDVFAIDADTLHRRFETHAPVLAAGAAQEAIERAGLTSNDIDAVVISTCTGYLCPGLTSYVSELLGLRSFVQAFDLVGQGCAAALPNMRLARSLLRSGNCHHVLSVCVEICSAAMYLDDDPGVLVSACLFGDGAGAAVLSAKPSEHARRLEWVDAESLIVPESRDALRFEKRNGMLRNILTREVPDLAATRARSVLHQVLSRTGVNQADIATWIMHAGGRDVLAAVEKKLELQSGDLRYSAAMLREYGNLSSAFVYYVLNAALQDGAEDGWWWMSSFGAGFACHGALLKAGE
ncbi:MAG: Chalcone and stilbene synthase domain protein [Paucimonas sp.]|jgi:alkylresorcinol/alkylpyrone synthase|nr:Chalcone and stilbene synthase domain protein [Paucimonas sp.]